MRRQRSGCDIHGCGGTLSGPSKLCGKHESEWEASHEKAMLDDVLSSVKELAEAAFTLRVEVEEATR